MWYNKLNDEREAGDMAEILLVEDDEALNEGIRIALEKDAHDVATASGFFEALRLLETHRFDLLLLDVNLPDGSGTTLCRKVRETDTVPIVFLTANDTEQDMVEGFRTGCDDYIAKPFSTTVLRLKIATLLKRSAADEKKNIFIYKDLELDFDQMSARVRGEDCRLTATEYRLLEYMIKNKGRVLTRNMLLEQVWDTDSRFVDENTLSVQIKRLRQKLERDSKNPEYIRTIFGIGYAFGE